MSKHIEITDGFDARVSALANQVGADKADLIRQLLDTALEEIEDFYRARSVAQRIQSGAEETIPLEEVERRFGLAD